MRQKQITGDKQMQRAARKEPMTETIRKKTKKYRNWTSMGDGEIISFAKNLIQENEIKNRINLRNADRGLYRILAKRNLLNIIFPEKQKKRNWSSMSDDELIRVAKDFIGENKIKNRHGLAKADAGLYYVLRKRKLLDAVIFKKRERRNWSSMASEELISYARKIIEKNGIENRKDLQKADGGLYNALKKRNLTNVVFPEKQKRSKGFFTKMSDEKLINYAKKIIEEKGLRVKVDLLQADIGLYHVLGRRELLNAVFSDIEKAKKTEAVKQVVDAMKEFGEKE